MNKKKRIIVGVLLVMTLGVLLTGCTSFQQKVDDYSKDKEQCFLNTENVTQFTYKSQNYTILEDTVSNGSLGEWLGYIRKLAAINENGKILIQENIEKTTFKSLADVTEKAPNAAYIISFLNVYAAPDDTTYLIVDVNGGYHKAVLSNTVTDECTVFNYKNTNQGKNGSFEVNPNNATQLIRNNVTYQVTSDIVSEDELGSYIDIIAENITFDVDTKKPLSKEEMNSIDWYGTSSQSRENWVYVDVYEVTGKDASEIVAVKVNNQYHLVIAE